MNLYVSKTQIMWKEIAIIFFAIFSVRVAIDLYVFLSYKKFVKKFFANQWNGLEEKIDKILKTASVFANGPFNKSNRIRYNDLCVIQASIAYMRDDEELFVNQLAKAKEENSYEATSFILALYYHSKANETKAKECFERYLSCNRENKNLQIIMNFLFKQDEKVSTEELNEAIRFVKNPAVLKLLKENNLAQ